MKTFCAWAILDWEKISLRLEQWIMILKLRPHNAHSPWIRSGYFWHVPYKTTFSQDFSLNYQLWAKLKLQNVIIILLFFLFQYPLSTEIPIVECLAILTLRCAFQDQNRNKIGFIFIGNISVEYDLVCCKLELELIKVGILCSVMLVRQGFNNNILQLFLVLFSNPKGLTSI